MKNRTMWLAVAVAAFLLLAAGAAGALPALLAPGDPVAGTINYQGRLTDPGGLALDGTFPMRFQVYNDSAGGTLLWDSGVVNVNVDHGLFSVGLSVDTSDFDGQGLWLRMYVDGEWLSPRQALLPVPYALSLKPGAEVAGTSNAGSILEVRNSANPSTGSAVWAEAATSAAVYAKSPGGHALYGYTEAGSAVYGIDGGADQAHGYGGKFYSANGVGVLGDSNALPTWNNQYAPGVYGHSANGVGVYGLAESATSHGPGGLFEGRMGIMSRSDGTNVQEGYAGYFVSESYRGIYAASLAGWYDAYFAGIGGIFSAGGYFSLRADRTVAVNVGDQALEPGDVVALAGVAPSPGGGEPLLAVRTADPARASAVVGVVLQALRVEWNYTELGAGESLDVQPMEGSIPPHGYLVIVTGGLVPAVRVDLSEGGLEIGDLLTISSVPGRVWRAGAGVESEGMVLGKVAGPVDAENGTVAVFITLQ